MRLMAEAGGDEEYARFPQNYRFQVPEDCHWRDVRAVTSNVSQALQKDARVIEQANLETLYGIFGDARTLWGKLFGQEKNLTTSAIARMNLFLHGAADFRIVRGDTLRLPAFLSGDNLATFDCVIANPPFSLEKWGEEVWTSDPYGRNFPSMPPAKSGDHAWVQHTIKSIAPATGHMAEDLPMAPSSACTVSGHLRHPGIGPACQFLRVKDRRRRMGKRLRLNPQTAANTDAPGLRTGHRLCPGRPASALDNCSRRP
jgi:hypothetical protein